MAESNPVANERASEALALAELIYDMFKEEEHCQADIVEGSYE